MKFSEINVGDHVEDEWWPFNIQGRIIKKLKTRIHLRLFNDCYTEGRFRCVGEIITYDKPHCQYLRKIR